MSMGADEVRVEITAQATQAEQALQNLKNTLGQLRDVTRGGMSLRTIANGISDMATGLNRVDIGKLQQLTEALEGLKGVGKLGLNAADIKKLTDIGAAAELMAGVDMTRFTELTQSLAGLKGVTISTSLAKELTKIAEKAQELNGMDFSGLERMGQALAPVVQNLQDANGELTNTVGALSNLSSKSSGKAGASMVDIFAGFKLAEELISKVTRSIAGAVSKANDYIEDYNLFTVSLGEYAKQAENFADRVSSLMGIDPSKWMRTQGIFMTLATGFGVASDRAYIMSKNLTQLGYDLSSFFNIAVEGEGGSMQKLQAAISGELEPLRRLGFDLSEARLKAVALSLGIDQTFNSMTQAQKAQLRYYAIMTQVTTAQGDMARTLNTPANQLRILKQQTEQAARAFGNVFIPILNQVLPYANAVAAALREVAEALASFFGFTMPEVDYSDVVSNIDTATDAVDDLGTSIGSASSKAEELKGLLADWDELNIIQSQNESGGGGSGGKSKTSKTAMNPDDWTFALPEYDFLKNYAKSAAAKIKEGFEPFLTWVKDNIAGVVSAVEAIGAGMLLWKIGSPFMSDLIKASQSAQNMSAAILGIGTATATITLDAKFTQDYLDNKSILSLIAANGISGLGSALTGSIFAKAFGKMFGLGAAGVTLTLTAAADLILTINNIKTEGIIGTEAHTTALIAAIKAGIGVGALVTGLTGGNVVLGVVGGVITMTVGAALSFVIMKATVAEWGDKLDWGEVELSAEDIKKYVEDKYFDQNVTVTIHLLETNVENVDNLKADLDKAVAQVSAELYTVAITGEIQKGDPAIQSIIDQITGTDGLVSKINEYLKTSAEGVKLAVAIAPLDTDGSNTQTGSFLSGLVSADSAIGQAATSLGNELATLLTKGFNEGLDETETERVNKLWQSMMNIQQAMTTGQAGAEFAIAAHELSDFTRGTFGAAVDAFVERRNELEAGIKNAVDTEYIATTRRVAGLEATMAAFDESTKEYKDAKAAYDSIVNSAWYADLLDPDKRAARRAQLVNEQVAGGDKDFRDAIIAQFGGAFANLDWYQIGSMIRAQNMGLDDTDSLLSILFADILDTSNLGGNEKNDLGKALAANLVSMTDLLGPEGMTALSEMLAREIKYASNSDSASLLQELVTKLFGMDNTNPSDNPIANALDNVYGDNNQFPVPKTDDALNELKRFKAEVISITQSVKHALYDMYSAAYRYNISPGGVNNGTNVSVAKNATLTLAQRASGGLPDVGEVFVANEAGPELIGRIGNRTAVANSDQIVTSVSNGVAQAQSEQNRLLREQNAYLKVIAAKSGKTTIAPSVELARVAKRSEELRLQAEGV